ncbi:alpha-amylase family protein [Edaphobacter modestus]|uniref:Beta-galactosidase-like protein n=1 Tax=Edaphobacter modestus TaxID=388466 RepID=A0A4Q7YW71_9BACT|nr:alpha-amylase family protein [Edaphobacter modestus]RZU41289.1 beta-galactosidase-like protein [Edaphobacter modestus]
MSMTRRDFARLGAGIWMATTAEAQPLARTIPEARSADAQQAHGSSQPWYRTIKRIGQTNFNEMDAKSNKVDVWADYWASARVQAVALSVSGPVAFYPSKVPFFHHSPYLEGRDLFGECVHAAKKRGIRVYARMSPDIQWTDPQLLETHPLWFRHNQDGSLQSSAPNIAFTCTMSEHYSKQQPAIIHELNANYDIDGVYMNGWPTIQVCYCDNCKEIGDPHSAAYRAMLMNRVEELINLYKATVLEKSPDNFYSCNLGGGLKESGLEQWRLTRDALWYTADNQSRSGVVAPIWQDAQQVKFARALMGDRPVAAVTASYGRAGQIMWRQVTDTTAEPTCRMAQTAAAGGIVWYHWLGLEQGFQEDRRWQAPGRDFLSWHAKNDAHFHNKRSLSKVAIVASSRSVTAYKAPYPEDRTDHLEGMYAALVEARIPFDFVHDEDLNAKRLAGYSALILPNVALLSDAQTQALEQYVQTGGSLLATFQTGLFDEHGTPRSDFALGKLFGIQKAGEPVRSSSQKTDPIGAIHLQSIRKRGPLSEGFEETTWIAGPVWRQPIAPSADADMTFIKPYPVYPPEAVYQREVPSDLPSIVAREAGSSRLVYMAGDMDSSFWRLDHPDLGRQIANAVRWILKDSNAVDVSGDGLIEVIAWETESGFAVHMLNYTGANAYRGHMRKPATLTEQQVRVVLPNGARIRKASLLYKGESAKFTQNGNIVTITVPTVGLYEVLGLEV